MSSLVEIHKNAPVSRSKALWLRGGFADTQPAGRQRLLRRRRENFESVFMQLPDQFLERDLASLGSQIIECYDIATGGGSPSASRRS